MSPINSLSVQKNTFFNLSVNVSCSIANCGDISVSIDPSTTVSLDYTHDLVDIVLGGSIPDYTASIIKWDISSIPSSNIITDGTLCLYINSTLGSPNGNIRTFYINNQSWTEATSTGEFDVLASNTKKLNNTNVTLSGSLSSFSWTCFNVTTLLSQAYSNSNSNFTVLFDYYDYIASPNYAGTNDFGLSIGKQSISRTGFRFEDRENSLTTGNRPYLNISYSTAGNSIYCVKNAGTTAVNGDYDIYGTQLGAHIYKKINSEVYIYKIANPVWLIGADTNGETYWYQNANSGTSIPLSGWIVTPAGSVPTPIITAGACAGGTKTGLIPVNTGNPFYTNESNPRTISLNKDTSMVVNFWINATGDARTYTGFFISANISAPGISAMTNKVDVTITS